MKIHIYPKDALHKGVIVKGYVDAKSNYNTLVLVGLRLADIVALRDYQVNGFRAGNAMTIDLMKYSFSIID